MSVHALILEKIEAAQSEGTTKLIAIDGRGGSGKSTFAARLIELNPGLELLELDSFPCSAEEYPFHQTGTQTRVSTKRILHEALEPLKNGQTAIFKKTFWWKTDDEHPTISVPSGGAVLVEGCYALLPELRPFYDLSIWVECSSQEAIERAIGRDGEEIRLQWETAYFPNEESYIETYNPRDFADLVVKSSGDDLELI